MNFHSALAVFQHSQKHVVAEQFEMEKIALVSGHLVYFCHGICLFDAFSDREMISSFKSALRVFGM